MVSPTDFQRSCTSVGLNSIHTEREIHYCTNEEKNALPVLSKYSVRIRCLHCHDLDNGDIVQVMKAEYK